MAGKGNETETNNDNDNDNDNGNGQNQNQRQAREQGQEQERGQGQDMEPERGERLPLWKNWRFLGVMAFAFCLILSGLLITFGPVVIAKVLSDPGTLALVGVLGTIGGLGVRFVSPIYEELKNIGERTSRNEKKTNRVSHRVDAVANLASANTRKNDDLADQMRMFKLNQDSQQKYIDDLQEQRLADKAELADLKVQLRDAIKESEVLRREISELKAQLREVDRESKTDKQEIIILRGQVTNLELEVAKLIIENSRLLEENRELKLTGGGRRATDKLKALDDLPPDMQKAFDEYRAADKKAVDAKPGENKAENKTENKEEKGNKP